ncbi:ATP-binding protein [Knoellia sp. S7-12]|uniref:ATP-binding protein n=1 Tax=Knoellia sp. S7-12 TaxID=3126698 RepID=UPI0033695A06
MTAAETNSTDGSSTASSSTGDGKLDEFGGAIGQGLVRTIRAPWGPSTVTRVRHAVVADLRARDLAEKTIDESEIVVSELMTNAIRHARPLADGCLRVRWKVRGEVVEVEVTDGGGDSVPVPAPASVWVSSGRGLRIIRSLAHEWGVDDDKGAQTVWAAMGGPSRRRAT